MPRTLPWLTEASSNKTANSSSAARSKRKRAKTPDLDDLDVANSDLDDLNTTGVSSPARRERQQQQQAPSRKRGNRTPSTSPPPGPPDVEYMREGYSQDDVWMMVEDEFLATAKLYTAHIHHAEYQRLKKLAKSRGDRTLSSIARQTDLMTEQSNSTRLRQEAQEKDKLIKDGMRKIDASYVSESEDDEYMQDPQLAGLMTGSQRASKDLTGMGKAKSNTRAAAGFKHSPEKLRRTKDTSPEFAHVVDSDHEDGDESDDLDAAPTRKSTSSTNGTSKDTGGSGTSGPSSTLVQHVPGHGLVLTKRTGIFKKFADPDKVLLQANGRPCERRTTTGYREAQAAKDLANTNKRSNQPASVSSSSRSTREFPNGEARSGPDFGGFTRSKESIEAAEFLAKRRAKAQARREKEEKDAKRKGTTTIDVPTFAI